MQVLSNFGDRTAQSKAISGGILRESDEICLWALWVSLCDKRVSCSEGIRLGFEVKTKERRRAPCRGKQREIGDGKRTLVQQWGHSLQELQILVLPSFYSDHF
jgi:hypothetical protein